MKPYTQLNDIKEYAEGLSTGNVVYPPSVRVDIDGHTRMEMDGTDEASRNLLDELRSTQKEQFIQELKTEVVRDIMKDLNMKNLTDPERVDEFVAGVNEISDVG